ncbi:hypothetical protein ACG94O_18410, partial [Acinetobacter ursingii]
TAGVVGDVADIIIENPGKTALVIGGTVATGGLAFVAAPAIATVSGTAGLLGTTATTGATISTLTGAALTNASLAALGGELLQREEQEWLEVRL